MHQIRSLSLGIGLVKFNEDNCEPSDAAKFYVKELLHHRRMSNGSLRILTRWTQSDTNDKISWEPAEILDHLEMFDLYLMKHNIRPESVTRNYQEWEESEEHLTSAYEKIEREISRSRDGRRARIEIFMAEIDTYTSKVYVLHHKNILYIVAYDARIEKAFVADQQNFCIIYGNILRDLEIITELDLTPCIYYVNYDNRVSTSNCDGTALIARKFKDHLNQGRPLNGRIFLPSQYRPQPQRPAAASPAWRHSMPDQQDPTNDQSSNGDMDNGSKALGVEAQ